LSDTHQRKSDSGCDKSPAAIAESCVDLAPGMVLANKYRLERELGRGGAGVVWKATNINTEHQVSLKFLLSVTPSPQQIQRFKKEARALARLNHPNIVRIQSLLPFDRSVVLVAEYVEGSSLSALLAADGAFDEPRALRLFMQIVDALEHAHAHGVVHRDIKSSNVMVRQVDGQCSAKLLDFGLASVSQNNNENQGLTAEGAIMGTPSHMSPEQFRGQKADARSDIYSFGCLMYEVITGVSAYEGDNAFEVAAKHLDPKRLDVKDKVSNARLAGVIQTCLALDPAERFQTVVELGEALSAADSRSQSARASARPRAMVRFYIMGLLILLMCAPTLFLLFGLNLAHECEERFRHRSKQGLTPLKASLNFYNSILADVPVQQLAELCVMTGLGDTIGPALTQIFSYGALVETPQPIETVGVIEPRLSKARFFSTYFPDRSQPMASIYGVASFEHFLTRADAKEAAHGQLYFTQCRQQWMRVSTADPVLSLALLVDLSELAISGHSPTHYLVTTYLWGHDPDMLRPLLKRITADPSLYRPELAAYANAILGHYCLESGRFKEADKHYDAIPGFLNASQDPDDTFSATAQKSYALHVLTKDWRKGEVLVDIALNRCRRSKNFGWSFQNGCLEAALLLEERPADEERFKKADKYFKKGLDAGRGDMASNQLLISYAMYQMIRGDLKEGIAGLRHSSLDKDKNPNIHGLAMYYRSIAAVAVAAGNRDTAGYFKNFAVMLKRAAESNVTQRSALLETVRVLDANDRSEYSEPLLKYLRDHSESTVDSLTAMTSLASRYRTQQRDEELYSMSMALIDSGLGEAQERTTAFYDAALYNDKRGRSQTVIQLVDRWRHDIPEVKQSGVNAARLFSLLAATRLRLGDRQQAICQYQHAEQLAFDVTKGQDEKVVAHGFAISHDIKRMLFYLLRNEKSQMQVALSKLEEATQIARANHLNALAFDERVLAETKAASAGYNVVVP
jgi:hypothetical protein